MQRPGRILAPLDMLIAAHALHAKAVLVTSDRSFQPHSGPESGGLDGPNLIDRIDAPY